MGRVGGMMLPCSFRVVGGRRGCVLLNPPKPCVQASFSSSLPASSRRRTECCPLFPTCKREFSGSLSSRQHRLRSTLSCSLSRLLSSSSLHFIAPRSYTTCPSSPSLPLSYQLLQKANSPAALSPPTPRSDGRLSRHASVVKARAYPYVSSLVYDPSGNTPRFHVAVNQPSSFPRSRRSEERTGKARRKKVVLAAGAAACVVGAVSLVTRPYLPTSSGVLEEVLPSREKDEPQQSGAFYPSFRARVLDFLLSSKNKKFLSSSTTCSSSSGEPAVCPGASHSGASSVLLSRFLLSPLSCSSSSDKTRRLRPQALLPAQCSSGGKADDSSAGSQAPSPAPSSPESLYQELSADSCLQLFAGTGHPELAREIAAHLNVAVGRAHVGRYADGECVIQVLDEVRGKDVFVIQSAPAAGGDVHSCLMELFLLLTALRR